MNEEDVLFLETPRQLPQKVAQAVVRVSQPLVMSLKLIAGPTDGPFGPNVEALRIK